MLAAATRLSKDDAPAPDKPPRKRRAIELVPDVWLAQWAVRESLTPSERARAQDERDRRKQERRRGTLAVGLVFPREGMTPQQRQAMIDAVPGTATVLHVNKAPNHLFFRLGVPITEHQDPQDVIRNADLVLVAPPRDNRRGDEWDLARYANHRRLPVTIVLPSGIVREGLAR